MIKIVKIKCPICDEQLIKEDPELKLPDPWSFLKHPYCKKCNKEWVITAHFKDKVYFTIEELEA